MGGGTKALRIGRLSDSQLEDAYAIKKQYLDDGPFDEWLAMRRDCPDLFLGCIRDAELIGVAYGCPSPRKSDDVVLHGIAVVEELTGRGYGSQLLQFFCEQVQRAGYATVSVGSPGGYVDRFYMKNGFRPAAFMISVPLAQSVPDELRAKHAVVSERIQGGLRRLYVRINSLDNELREKLLTDFQALGVVAIMVKTLDDSGTNHRNGDRAAQP